MKTFFGFSAALILLISLSACKAEIYGPGGTAADAKHVKVKDVLMDGSMAGRAVTVEGIITLQCGSNGCWFFVDDGTGRIYVDLSTNKFALPPRTGKMAKVTGTAQNSENGMVVIASRVEVR